MTGAEAFEAVLNQGTALPLSNAWRIARRRFMGEPRVEIKDPSDTDLATLRRMRCTVEIVYFRARMLAPDAAAVARVLDRWPLAT